MCYYIGVARGPAGPAMAGPLFLLAQYKSYGAAQFSRTSYILLLSLAGPLFSPVRRPCINRLNLHLNKTFYYCWDM